MTIVDGLLISTGFVILNLMAVGWSWGWTIPNNKCYLPGHWHYQCI